MKDRFEVADTLIAEMLAHARECYPEEACGIIAGIGNHGTVLYRGRNHSPSPRIAFELDPVTLARQLELEDAGLTMSAVYHSHPNGPAAPSKLDIERAAEGYPDSLCIICSLAGTDSPIVRAFRIEDGAAREISLAAVRNEDDLTGCPLRTKLMLQEM